MLGHEDRRQTVDGHHVGQVFVADLGQVQRVLVGDAHVVDEQADASVRMELSEDYKEEEKGRKRERDE